MFQRLAGSSLFGGSGFGVFLTRLLVLMVLTSAAASTQTTILPTARTTLSMATYKALPRSFAKMHPRYLTPTFSTIATSPQPVAHSLWPGSRGPIPLSSCLR